MCVHVCKKVWCVFYRREREKGRGTAVNIFDHLHLGSCKARVLNLQKPLKTTYVCLCKVQDSSHDAFVACCPLRVLLHKREKIETSICAIFTSESKEQHLQAEWKNRQTLKGE